MNYRIVYCSRNRIDGTPQQTNAEVQNILRISRINNAASGVTGALLFNGKAFAQVLEGPRDAVDIAYAKIRFDPRHSHVVVLEQSSQVQRHFPAWTMAYSDARSSTLQSLDMDAAGSEPATFAQNLLKLLKSVVDAHGE